ncbi:MAG: DNA replication/repair protein RecF [Clostridiales bacterium]|jgi:DNA replication and repair protein recF|nr:DNA replication/repair protein RecF [Clostridiales bacterium]
MKIKQIKLINFRNLENVELNFINNINIIIGGNGAGKTNILEAVYLNSLTKSFRANNDIELIKFNKDFLTIKTIIKENSYNEKVLYNIDKISKKIYLNSNKITKLSEYIGKYPVVISTPEDVLMIKTSPSNRRDVLNISICQFNKEYFKTLNEYNKLLKLRNDYLKRILVNSNSDMKYFEIITTKLIEKAIYIYIERNKYINSINSYLGSIFEHICLNKNLILKYSPNVDITEYDDENISKILQKKFKRDFNKEISLGMTISGPHRDDFNFYLDNKDMKFYSSEGQKKMAVISYKLAEMKLFQEQEDKKPIILLDDLFSELDIKNKNRLVKYIPEDMQVIITSNDLKGINKSIRDNAKIFKIKDSEVRVINNGRSN